MRACLPVAFGAWLVLVVLWFFTCYHFGRGRIQIDGWWMTCRPGFEYNYTVMSAFLFLIIALVARRLFRSKRQP